MASPSITTLRGGEGHFRISVTHPSGKRIDLTTFRGVPTIVNSYSSADPFGDASAVISFPAVTSFDRPGYGDLWWWVPWADVNITWYDMRAGLEVSSNWAWEGFIVSEEISGECSLQCKGALYQADNFLAAPFYPQYPIPYEKLISMALDPKTHPSLRTKPLKIEFPTGWNVKVPKFTEPSYLYFLKPWGVSEGQLWSGLTSRSTGGWEPTLTGFIQSLLAVMFTDNGDQWTISKGYGRVPILRVRAAKRMPDEQTLVVFNQVPGIQVNLSRDFSQSANVIYGAGTDLAGTSFSGAQVTTDGSTTYYEPFAAQPQVYPADASNPRLIPTMMRKESRLTFQQGIDEQAARDVAMTQLKRFSDPGYAGTISLESDPMIDGEPFNRFLIQAGSSILVKNWRGSDLLMHITQVDVTPEGGSVSLSVDSKFRDALTSAEVKARTRDALDPVNLLKAGQYSVTVQDQLKPWSYSEGSGIIPSGGTQNAAPLFKAMPPNTKFPWTTYTTKYPPKKYPQYYIKIGPKSKKATENWGSLGRDGVNMAAIPIKASQNATIRLTQLAAYDENGNQIKVRFHAGIYMNSGTSVNDMPMINAGAKGMPYPAGDRYPFFPGAFDTVKPNGEEQNNPNVLLPDGAQQVVAWGTHFEPAGYSPGLYSSGSGKTGRLVDEGSWSFDASSVAGWDKYSAANNAKNKTAGMLYILIFCDDHPVPSKPIYFLGRLYRSEPGA